MDAHKIIYQYILLFLFFWWYILVLLLKSIPALLNFHFKHWLYLISYAVCEVNVTNHIHRHHIRYCNSEPIYLSIQKSLRCQGYRDSQETILFIRFVLKYNCSQITAFTKNWKHEILLPEKGYWASVWTI
jgi:hypothetical protein